MCHKYAGSKWIDELVVLGSMPACGKSNFRKDLEDPLLSKAPSELKSVFRNSMNIQEDDLRKYPDQCSPRLVLEVDFSTRYEHLNRGHYCANVKLEVLKRTDCLFALILWAPQEELLIRYVERHARRGKQKVPSFPYSRKLLDRIETETKEHRRHLVSMYSEEHGRGLLAKHYNEWLYFVRSHKPKGCWIVDTTQDPYEFVPVDEWDGSQFQQ